MGRAEFRLPACTLTRSRRAILGGAQNEVNLLYSSSRSVTLFIPFSEMNPAAGTRVMPRFRTLPCRCLPLKRHEARFDAAQARQLKRTKRERVEAGNESAGFSVRVIPSSQIPPRPQCVLGNRWFLWLSKAPYPDMPLRSPSWALIDRRGHQPWLRREDPSLVWRFEAGVGVRSQNAEDNDGGFCFL